MGLVSRKALVVPLLVAVCALVGACTPPSARPGGGTPATTTAPPMAAPTAVPSAAPTPITSTAALPTTTTPPPAGTGAGPLPFDLPPAQSLRGSGKRVFAHYFTPYPLSLDNLPPGQDYYDVNYLRPEGENGKFAAQGGLLRQRPLPRAPLAGDYRLEDMKTEVRRAVAAGIDGFAVDLLAYSGSNWDATRTLIAAAGQVDPGFTIMLEPDMTSLPADPAALSRAITTLAASPSVFRLGDGSVVVAPFAAEKLPVAWWTQWLNSMRTGGTTVALVPVFVDASPAADFVPISYGLSTWGSRSPAVNRYPDAIGTLAHAQGRIWMQPVSAQDERPRSTIYDEALNTENLRMTWGSAISGADWVQIPTWNDYSEGAEIAPSTHTGYVFLDLCSYYLTWFKTGRAPALTHDVAYLTSRVQPAAARPTGGQTQLMTLRPGSSPPRDTVEVLTFLTAPATVQAIVGGQPQTYSAPAGMSAKLFPLAAGTNGVTLLRDGKPLGAVTSPFPVVAAPVVQDLQYYGVSTSR